jgi:flagellar biosynthetic protein FliQ
MILPTDLVDLAREAIVLTIVLSLPMLGAALLAGLVTSSLQVLTKISEPTLTYVPRIIAVSLMSLVAAPWIGSRVAGFAERVWVLL